MNIVGIILAIIACIIVVVPVVTCIVKGVDVLKESTVTLLALVGTVILGFGVALIVKDTTVDKVTDSMVDKEITEADKKVEKGESLSVEEIKQMNNFERASFILDRATEKTGNNNSLFSPVSFDFALGMVTEGTSGNTLTQLNNLLGSEGYTDRSVALFSRADECTQKIDNDYLEYKQKLHFANSIWISDEYNIQKDYKKTLVDKYKAEVEAVNFKGDKKIKSVEKINDWCNTNTEGMIPEILKPEIVSEDISSILVNTVYFESPWRSEWSDTDKVKEFNNIDGTKAEHKFIRCNDLDRYYETKDAQAFSTKYMNGISFYCILPKKTGDFKVSDLDISKLLENEDTSYTKIKATIPELDYDYTVPGLVDTCIELGVTDIFNDNLSQANNIIETKEGVHVPLKVTDIIQKCKIELNKNGTKAAAATAILMENCAMALPEKEKVIDLTFDRPYVYMIYDEVTEEIIFIGKVVNF